MSEELTAKLKSLTLGDPMAFPIFPRLPTELRLMIWRRCLRNEAASRIVLVHGPLPRENPFAPNAFSRASVPELRIMPLKRLISPLLMVSRESRGEALRHYPTRIDIISLPSAMEIGINPPGWMARIDRVIKQKEEQHEATIRRMGYVIPCPKAQWLIDIEQAIVGTARSVIEDKVRREAVHGEYWQPRGCIRLDMQSDRFLYLRNWTPTVLAPQLYGMRVISEVFDDYLDGRSDRVNTERILAAPCPPVLCHASAPLAPEVKRQVRHVVFPHFDSPSTNVFFQPNEINGCPDFPVSQLLLDNAAVGPEGSISAFAASAEMYRSFFDDVEDRGPGYLDIRPCKLADVEYDMLGGGGGGEDGPGIKARVIKWEKDVYDQNYCRL